MAKRAALSADAVGRLLRPRSVAIVGASPTPGALGHSLIVNLEQAGFAGAVHLVNPRRDEIGGRACLRSIGDLPADVDVAVLAIPRAAVLETLRALAARRVGAAIIFSAGFAEGGEEGIAEQREIGRIAAAAGMVIEGPNCLGTVNFIANVPLTFVDMPRPRVHTGKRIGIVSQSGAMAAVIATTLIAKDLALSYFVSTGNEAASGIEDYVDWLIDDPDTQAIALVVEQFRDPARFQALARRARGAGKPIVLLHPGRSAAARDSAATHTGAMAGDYDVMRVLVERAGVILCRALEEVADVLDLAVRCGPIAPGTAILGESGAFKALALDVAEEIGLDLPPFDDALSPKLRAALPEFVGVSNPVDLTAQALVDPDLYRRTFDALLDDDRLGAIILSIIQTDERTARIKFPPIIDAIRGLRTDKAVIFTGVDEGAGVPAEYVAALRGLGVPYLPTPDRAFRAVARWNAWTRADPAAADPSAPALALPAGGVIPEYRSKALLAPLGIAFPAGRFVTSLDEAQAAATEIGWPVVIKVQAAALSHKSDVGGVVLNLGDTDALAAGWAKLHADVSAHAPGVPIDGVLVEAMGARGLELIVGGRNDPDWGPVVLVGAGGVMAELFHDVRLLPADLAEEAIAAELRALKSGALLDGFRGSAPLDVAALARVVGIVGALLRANPRIAEIDLNPVIVYPQGEGVVALDALLLTAPAGDL
ncbi:acetate--CoA ligase family protein [uncultured Sphingomonas sp.]|uniref:acetate--CoA ligase family protein n=1 Tax=uncultured Sphingomonas sp. TaxID=158754 RepID=UPI0035CA0D81